MSGTGPTITLPNGMRLELQGAEQLGCASYVAREIFAQASYAQPGFEIGPADVVVDVGANMGLFALWAAPQASRGRVICIEPTGVIDCLERSLPGSGLSNVEIVRCAIGREEGFLTFVEYPGFTATTHAAEFRPATLGQLLIHLLWRSSQKRPVRTTCRCRRLEDVLAELGVERVDLLKIDCEGGEYDIVDSLSDRALGRISRIVMEFHRLHRSHDHGRLVRRLRDAGFQVRVCHPWFARFVLKTGMIWARRELS